MVVRSLFFSGDSCLLETSILYTKIFSLSLRLPNHERIIAQEETGITTR